MPTLLMQDLSLSGHVRRIRSRSFGKSRRESTSSNLADWHRVIDWWFDKYGRYAVAVKSQHAYDRDIDYNQVPAEEVEGIFKRKARRRNAGSRGAKGVGRPSVLVCRGKGDRVQPAGQTAHRLLCGRQLDAAFPLDAQRQLRRATCAGRPPTPGSFSCTSAIRITRS